ncbi:hypothetical protein [Lichenihabitans psoromatis]|uniref:hypothetical protein n=1 Tax=Lichenihabitans psoromatis TaxID=2528642 RepID=UPI0010384C5B|nr:hypothetical protein [Lichenihabitans psoromatis]
MTEVLLRKSAQEVEIDHLLAEEFACDPAFSARFLAACDLALYGFRVTATIAEPSLGGDGFGDLLVEGTIADGSGAVLLIEDKITAGPAVRQAERYAAFAGVLRERGVVTVLTILVAPASYRGERDRFDACLSLETVSTLIASTDPLRLAYRRRIIESALAKKAAKGVRVPDPAMLQLKEAYLQFASGWCAREGLNLTFPSLRHAYYDGDSWVDGIRHPELPAEVTLRHRFWTTSKAMSGLIDLIVSPISVGDRKAITDCIPAGAHIASYSNGKGIQLSFPVGELRQRTGFDDQIAAQALKTMKTLVDWYRANLA